MLAYLLLFGFAYTRFNNRQSASSSTATVAPKASSNLLSLPALTAATDTPASVLIAELPEIGANQAVTPVETASPALEAATEPVYQAEISFPKDGDLLITKDGWVTLEGSSQALDPDDILFIVIQTDFWGEPIIWLQQELRPDEAGRWTSLVKYGTPGYEYQTYVIATKDRAAADRLRELKRFGAIPPEFSVVSNKLINAYAN
jgi:hypothetical protein